MAKTKAYWEFHMKVGTTNPAKLTKEMMKQIQEAILKLPEVSQVEIKEQYERRD